MLHRLYHRLYRAQSLVKFKAAQEDINASIQLFLEEIDPLIEATENMIQDYYSTVVAKFKTIREAFLGCFIFLCLVFYFLVYKRAISVLEKKKQQTRSMLLMIPSKAFTVALALREAVADMVLY